MSFLSLLFLVAALQAAALPEVAVVGIHHPDGSLEDTDRGMAKLVRAADATRAMEVVGPDQLALRLEGRQEIVLTDAFLGSGRKLLDEGRVLYERADPEQAIPILMEAARSLSDGMAYATDNRSLLDSLLFLGLAHMVVGEDDAARDVFARMVVLDPARELDPINYAPRMVSTYTSVRDEVLALGTGSIAVETPEPGARVYIDGRRVGTTPTVLEDLPKGRHFLMVLGEDGGRTFGMVAVQPDKRSVVKADLSLRTLAEPSEGRRERARQVEQLYRALGDHCGTNLVLVAGVDDEGALGLQLYSTRSGVFSRVVTGEAGSDPWSSAARLLDELADFISPNGALRADRVSPEVLSLDISANPVLADLLLRSRARTSQPRQAYVGPEKQKGSLTWAIYTGAGVLAVGGAAATWLLVSGADGDETGTITVGPIP